MWVALAVLACGGASEKDGACPEDCDTTLTTTPGRGEVVAQNVQITVSVAPDDRAFDAVVLDGAGEEVGGVTGVGSAEVIGGPYEAGPHTLVVRSSCEPAPAAPCIEDTVPFEVTPSTDDPPTDDPPPTGSAPNAIDVLFVVDDSDTMIEEQALLATAAPAFVDALFEFDPRFAVVTTSLDTSGGALVGGGVLNADDGAELATRLAIGVGGDDKEKGIGAVIAALEASPAAFRTATTRLVVIAVTDEEDCTDDGALDGEYASACYTELDQLPPVSDLLQRIDAPDLQIHAIIAPDAPTCEAFPSARWAEAAASTGGTRQDLCTDALDDSLATIAQAATAPTP